MSRKDCRSENSYALRTSEGDLYGSSTRFREARSNINSGSSVPSMCRCNSAFGMRSTKLFTDPPSPKNTPVDTFVIVPQQGFFCGKFQKTGEAATIRGAGL